MDVYCYRRSRLDPTPLPIEQLPVRAMMAPPGHPDFYSRARLLAPGVVRVRGKVCAFPNLAPSMPCQLLSADVEVVRDSLAPPPRVCGAVHLALP